MCKRSSPIPEDRCFGNSNTVGVASAWSYETLCYAIIALCTLTTVPTWISTQSGLLPSNEQVTAAPEGVSHKESKLDGSNERKSSPGFEISRKPLSAMSKNAISEVDPNLEIVDACFDRVHVENSPMDDVTQAALTCSLHFSISDGCNASPLPETVLCQPCALESWDQQYHQTWSHGQLGKRGRP
eukprot:gb/GECG01003838.1/.p1 GENE.gb/GECG01003838.1/~~gb/GECG01003838.1/.p1  ORF type:complete len:185 (+),score=15.87 gb/GECG01003838.1/:1-555(+)